MKLRRIVSLFLLLGTIFLLITSVILYIVPPGRVAYWAEWKLWGLTKTEWTNLHINLGLCLLIAAGFHIYYNWKAVTNYLKSPAKQMVVFTGDFIVALLIGVILMGATYWEIPPFVYIQTLNEAAKDRGSALYGEPPYGHAELSTLETFTRRLDMDLPIVLERLGERGFVGIDPKADLATIAEENDVSPQTLYDAMRGPEQDAAAGGLPKIPAPGTGKLQLRVLCQNYGLDVQNILTGLAAEGLTAEPGETLQEIAVRHAQSPDEIYEVIRRIADQ